MGEFRALIEKLSDDRLDGLMADDMGVHNNLREVVQALRLIRHELEAGETLSREEITQTVRSQVLHPSFGNEIDALINEMSNYGPKTENPNAARRALLGRAERLKNTVIESLRPIVLVRVDEPKWQALLAEARQALDIIEQTQADLANQQTALAQASVSEASTELATYYKDEADEHGKTAMYFLWASGVVGGALALGTVLLLFVWEPVLEAVKDASSPSTTAQWFEVAHGTVARLVALSLAAFVLAFVVRNYRVNKHLQVLNKRRENALNTFGLLQASVTTDEARNLIVGELVRAVFTSEETGYLAAETERTVIESPGGVGILSAMTAMNKSAS